MIRREIVPVGWPCTLAECPPGPFLPLAYMDELCHKSEYGEKAYNSAGEYYTEGVSTLVQPVEMRVVNYEPEWE